MSQRWQGEELRCATNQPAEAVRQFNDGTCDSCGGKLKESAYVGGDHDEIAYCPACGKHFGCLECDRRV